MKGGCVHRTGDPVRFLEPCIFVFLILVFLEIVGKLNRYVFKNYTDAV